MKKLWNLLREQWRNLFHTIPNKIREYASKSLEVTTALKNMLNSPVLDIVTALIPGTWDDAIRSAMVAALEKSLPYLQVVDKCKDAATLEEMVLCWLTEVRKMPQHVQNALLMKLAALLTAILDNNDLRQSHYDYYLQLLYSGNKEATAA